MKFPDFFPENCPPSDSVSAYGDFYRVVTDKDGRTLKKEHLKSHREKQPNRTFPPDLSECELCSVSLLKDLEEAKNFAKFLLAFPSNRNKIGRIAYGTLSSEMGKIKHTPKPESNQLSHYDWWCPEGFDATTCFTYNDVKIDHD
jgi:hypothetical protein